MKTDEKGSQDEQSERPLWQKITGINPASEKTMSPALRDAAIRRLLNEVERRAEEEIDRKDVPAGERTVYWDPLERICMQLEISRTKLSSLSRELTGLRAHEICDRIKAKTLPGLVRTRLLRVLAREFDLLRKNVDRARVRDRGYLVGTVMRLWKLAKLEHASVSSMRWAMELGFPNPSRLQKACLLGFGCSIQEMEARMIEDIVQKIFSDEQKDLPQRTRDDKIQEPNLKHQEREQNPVADAIIKQAVDDVMRARGVA